MKTAVSLVAILFSGLIHADDIRLGEPVYGGNGCPSGTASATLSPDQKELSILFDQYSVEVGGFTGKNNDRKSCNLAIPVYVPAGYSISIYQVDYRGYALIPSGGQGQFNVEYFFAGAQGPYTRQVYNGPTDRNFLVQHNLAAEALIWTRCGESVNLRINSNVRVKSNRYNDEAYMSVDSADVASRLVYHVQWRRCW